MDRRDVSVVLATAVAAAGLVAVSAFAAESYVGQAVAGHAVRNGAGEAALCSRLDVTAYRHEPGRKLAPDPRQERS